MDTDTDQAPATCTGCKHEVDENRVCVVDDCDCGCKTGELEEEEDAV